MHVYDIADEFGHEFSSGENDDKWKLYGAPLRIMETIQAQSLILEKQKEAFIKEMEQEQEEFEEALDSLGITVGGFATYDDLAKYEEIAENVESVNARIQECIEKSRLFNQREFLVGKEQKDYSKLQALNKQFQPFSNLWLTTRKWFERHESWTKGEWNELDPDELDATFEQCNKTMN
jgi:dynein heavy chain